EATHIANALIDFRARDSQQAVDGELLDCKRSHHRTVDHRATHVRFAQVTGCRQITDETPSEGITRAGRIEDTLQWERRSEEDGVLREHERTVLALLDDHV